MPGAVVVGNDTSLAGVKELLVPIADAEEVETLGMVLLTVIVTVTVVLLGDQMFHTVLVDTTVTFVWAHTPDSADLENIVSGLPVIILAEVGLADLVSVNVAVVGLMYPSLHRSNTLVASVPVCMFTDSESAMHDYSLSEENVSCKVEIGTFLHCNTR